MPTAPVLPLSVSETEAGLTLVVPRASDSDASDVENVVAAFREAIATVYTARILRAAAALFRAHPEAPSFGIEWSLEEDHGQRSVVPRITTPHGCSIEDFPEGERVLEEALGVHTDPEVLAHLNDWLGGKKLTLETIDGLGRRRVGPGWDHVRSAHAAAELDSTLPSGPLPRLRANRV